MEVDSTPAPAPEANRTTTESNGTATSATTIPKKFSPPIDPTNQDLLPECIVYLRLLLLLANLDAGKIQEVSGHGKVDLSKY